jgi:hypothetical protein
MTSAVARWNHAQPAAFRLRQGDECEAESMDDERIVRLARTICRAARIDPDRPLVAQAGIYCEAELREPPQPAWMRYRAEAARFISSDPRRLETA